MLAAPMAGGSTTPALVGAAAEAGSLGFLAAGYRTAADLEAQVREVRAATGRFGVNLFAPNPVPVDPAAYRAYRERLLPLAERYDVELPPAPVEDDDAWGAKVDVLLADPPPVVSFTFGLPPADAVTALRGAGCLLAQTVTDVAEARLAAEAGVDLLVVQGVEAGGHSGVFAPSSPAATTPDDLPLVERVGAVRAAVDLPLVAAGGLSTAAGVQRVLAAGAQAVAVGTALLLAPQAGTSAAVRAALTGPDRGAPVLVHAFTGRPARGLRNAFVADHEAAAPLGYPALHHLTSPIRKAAGAAVDAEHVNVWAGAGYRSVVERPAAETLRLLAGG